jgi:hypothetical protein
MILVDAVKVRNYFELNLWVILAKYYLEELNYKINVFYKNISKPNYT